MKTSRLIQVKRLRVKSEIVGSRRVGSFLWSPCPNAEGMNLPLQQISDRRIDQAVTLHRSFATEGGGNDRNAEVTTAASAGVTGMGRALIADLQLLWR